MNKLVVAAVLNVAILGVSALGACHHNAGEPSAAGAGGTTISNSAGSYAPSTNNVPGTNTDATGVGATGVSPGNIGNAPTPDTTSPNTEALEPTAPASATP